MSDQILTRLEQVERRLANVERALGVVREPVRPPVAPPATASVPPPAPARQVVPTREHPPPPPRRPAREIDWSVAFGPKGLAVAGGIVTVLGIVFFFALAVNRGWIGPGARVALGSAASLLVFGAGLELRRRYGPLHAPVAAVGAGIAGGYATLLAATTLYGFVPQWGALMIAAAIAAIGLAVSLFWRNQLVAGIGLLGAMVTPALLIFDTGLTTVGTGFVALVLAAAAAVAVVLRWHARTGGDAIDAVVSSFVIGSAGFAFYAAHALFAGGSDVGRGIDLLAFAAGYGALGAAFFARRSTRDLGVMLVALALALAAVGVADVLSAGSLTYVWAAETVVLAWLARRLREIRFQVAALAYLALGLIHALAVEAPVSRLFEVSDHPGAGIPSLGALALASAAVALWTTDWPPDGLRQGAFARLAAVLDAVRERQTALGIAAASLAGALCVDAISLALLEAYSRWWPGVAESRFDHGHVALTGLWSAAAVVAVALGLRRRGSALAAAALVWLVVVLVKTIVFDAAQLEPDLRSYAFLEVAAALLAAGVLVKAVRARLWPDPTVSYLTVLVSLGLTTGAIGELLDGRVWRIDLEGAGFLGVAALYGGLAAAFLRRPAQRDFSTLLWTFAAGVLALAEAELVSGQWLVVTWEATDAAFAGLRWLTSERRLQLAAVGDLGLTFSLSFADQATLADLFSANENPGAGVPGLAAVVVATVVAARLWRTPRRPALDAFDAAFDRRQPRLRSAGTWIAAGLALYGLSLTILQVAEWVGPSDVTSNFQSGHTAVSAVWGALGLSLLYVGLRSRQAALRFGGLALFGISLAKLFVYDLARLSSITRALSFLAVGAVLLLGGFFYQRLAPRLEEREKVAMP